MFFLIKNGYIGRKNVPLKSSSAFEADIFIWTETWWIWVPEILRCSRFEKEPNCY